MVGGLQQFPYPVNLCTAMGKSRGRGGGGRCRGSSKLDRPHSVDLSLRKSIPSLASSFTSRLAFALILPRAANARQICVCTRV